MRAVVDSVIRLSGLQPKAHELLWRGLTFPNPEYLSRVRFNRWVGATPEEITLLEPGNGGEVIVPRGAVGLVRRALAAVREPLTFEDRRATHPLQTLEVKLALRDYQEEAVAVLVKNIQGCAVVPCGGGKTVIGTAAIARIGQPALVLVHTHDLAEQWRAAFRDIVGVEAGDVEGSSAMAVATVQSLAAMDPERRTAIGRRFGTVVVDEVHHVPANTFREVLGAMPGKFRLGLTATPTRADGLTPLVELCIGPIVFRIAHDELVAAGHLVIPQVVVVPTGCTVSAETFAGMIDELRLSVGRDRLIVDLAAREAKAGRSVLVLSARVKHCELLAQMLRQAQRHPRALPRRDPAGGLRYLARRRGARRRAPRAADPGHARSGRGPHHPAARTPHAPTSGQGDARSLRPGRRRADGAPPTCRPTAGVSNCARPRGSREVRRRAPTARLRARGSPCRTSRHDRICLSAPPHHGRGGSRWTRPPSAASSTTCATASTSLH
jgi:hypothetical protein